MKMQRSLDLYAYEEKQLEIKPRKMTFEANSLFLSCTFLAKQSIN